MQGFWCQVLGLGDWGLGLRNDVAYLKAVPEAGSRMPEAQHLTLLLRNQRDKSAEFMQRSPRLAIYHADQL